MNEKHLGKVKWFNADKGFGFIESKDFDGDVFVHFSGIEMDGFKLLRSGEEVEFESTKNEKGIVAVKVKSLKKAS